MRSDLRARLGYARKVSARFAGLALCAFAACSEARWDVTGDAAIVVALSEDGRLSSATFGRGRVLVEEGNLLAFPLSAEDFTRADGAPIEFASWSAGPATSPPPESCGRCRAGGGSEGPLLVGAGDFCAIPPWIHAASEWRDGELVTLRASSEARARELVALSVPGPCDLHETSVGDPSPMTICPVSPPDAPIKFGRLGVSGGGDVLGLAAGVGMLFPRSGGVISVDLPEGNPGSPAALAGGDFLVPMNEARSATLHRLRRDGQIAPLGVSFRQIATPLTLRSGAVVIPASEGRPVAAICRADGVCESIGMPASSTEGCEFLASDSTLEAAIELDEVIAFQYHLPAGFLYYRPDAPVVCQRALVAGAPELDVLGTSAIIGEFIYASAIESASHDDRPTIVRARLLGSSISSFEVLLEVLGVVQAIIPTEAGLRVFTSDEVVDLSLEGRLLSRQPADTPDSFPGIPRRITKISTSTTGWMAVEDELGNVFARRSERLERLYGSESAGPEPVRALARADDRCVAAVTGQVLSFSRAGPGCHGIQVELTPEPSLKSTPEVGFGWGQGAGFVAGFVAEASDWVVLRLEQGTLSEVAAIAKRPEERLVGAVELNPVRALLAFASGRLVRVDTDSPPVESVVPYRLTSISSAGGVAWLGGVDSLLRVTPSASGLVVDDWSSKFNAVARELPGERTIASLYAADPDQLWILVREASVRASEQFQYDYLFRLAPSGFAPELSDATGSDPLSSAARAYHFAGVGPRMTAASRFSVIRGPTEWDQPLDAVSLADCGTFMILGGSARHAAAIVDEE